jgi:cytochrome b561
MSGLLLRDAQQSIERTEYLPHHAGRVNSASRASMQLPISSMNPAASGSYTRTAIGLHWLIAIALAGTFALGIYMHELPLSPQKLKLYSWHKWAGVSIFLFVTLRLMWRLRHRPPALPAAMPRWQVRIAEGTHHLLYLLMFAVPLSGWLMSSAKGFQTVWFGVLPLPDLLQQGQGTRRPVAAGAHAAQLQHGRPGAGPCRSRHQASPDRPRRCPDAHAALPRPPRSHKMRTTLSSLALIASLLPPKWPRPSSSTSSRRQRVRCPSCTSR